MTGDGMCGVFIPDRVLAGWWRSQWKASDLSRSGNHCYTNSRKGGIRRVHYSDPTSTRIYIPAPFHNLLCTYPPTSSYSPSTGSSTSLTEPCQVKIHHTSHPLSHFIHLPMKMELIEGSETSAIRTHTLGNYPKENILHIYKIICHTLCSSAM